MLPPVTRKFKDLSTERYYQFAFYCDACGAVWTSERYPFCGQRETPMGAEEQKAMDLLWKTDHTAAYERANQEAMLHFNKCPLCGKRVCDDCFSELALSCRYCHESEGEIDGDI